MSILLIGFIVVAILVLTAGALSTTPDSSVSKELPGEPHTWDNQFRYAAAQHNLPPDIGPLLLKAIADHESAGTWNPEILGDFGDRCADVYAKHPSGMTLSGLRVSTAGYCALGLMQVHRYYNPGLAATYDLLDASENILAGATIVGGYWYQYSGDWQKVLAAYNGGPLQANLFPDGLPDVSHYVSAVGGTFRALAGTAGVAV